MNEYLDQLRILVVDDEPSIRTAIVASLEMANVNIVAVSSAETAREACRRKTFDVAILDVRIGDENGIDLLATLLSEEPWMKVVIITAFASFELAVHAMQRGAFNFLPKPFTPDQLRAIVGEAGRLRRMEQQLAERPPSDQCVDFASADPAMTAVVEMAREVATTDATILIRGETGTGKGELAKAIHQWSRRAARSFGVISCPSLAADLLESELFGHVKGAFTNAVRDNPGRIAACDGGTVFLDEIGELPLPLQPKLLRFIQDRQYERVGDHVTRKADVRIVSATNSDLEDAVKAGRFREDLLYRLNVIQLQIPPLRARKEDAVLLAQRLVPYFARHLNKPQLMLSDEACAAIRRHTWPGNIRELRNVIERAAILARSALIGPEMLGLSSGSDRRTHSPELGSHLTMEKIEELHIRGVLATTASLEEASAILGMDSVTLWRRRKKYGIE